MASAKVLQFARNAAAGRVLGRGVASDVQVDVAGLGALMREMEALPEALQKKAVWAALGGAGAIVKRAAVALAPELQQDTPTRRRGTVKRAIRVSRSRINRGQRGLYEVIVRVKLLKAKQIASFKSRTGKSGAANPDDPYYWWFLEFGTSKMSKRPFLRPAFDSTKREQLEWMRRRMKAAIEREARRIALELPKAA